MTCHTEWFVCVDSLILLNYFGVWYVSRGLNNTPKFASRCREIRHPIPTQFVWIDLKIDQEKLIHMSPRHILFALFAVTIGIAPLPLQAQQVPRRMEYCGIELSFTPEARQKLTELVYQLTNSPRYFNQMVKRANLYMPFIEEAFEAEGVPEDLKFIAIQESGLQASVVSSSDAVGFWQFKAPTGREMGLRIDDLVDERRHILRASIGAAKYFAKANYYYDNWVYAIIAYYEGQSGSLPYTEAEYYGAKRMEITAELHWYVLKAIAHKLAYEGSLERPVKLDTYLIPQSTQGETNLKTLVDRHGLSVESFQEHNPWLLSSRRLPRDGASISYYIPVEADRYPGHVQDPILHPPVAIVDAGGQPVETDPSPYSEPFSSHANDASSGPDLELDPQPLTPDAHQTSHLDDLFFAAFPVKADIHYGQEYVMYDGENSVVDLSTQHEVRFTKLLEWNGLKAGKDPEPGTIIYLNKPSKALYHIVEPGDDLAKIATRYGSSIRKIQRFNNMASSNLTIYVGQKLYLKGRKRKDEKMIVLMPSEQWVKEEFTSLSEVEQLEAQEPTEPIFNPAPSATAARPRQIPTETPSNGAATQPRVEPSTRPAPTSADQGRSLWIKHIVRQGETLWAISQEYQTRVDIIKQVNQLTDDVVHPGQELHILVRESVLRSISSRGNQ